MPKKVLVIYFSQTGQLREIINAFIAPFEKFNNITVVIKELKPVPAFPFPWSSDSFFQAMPESVIGIPCEIEPLALKGENNFDLIVIAWQPWYLSPSIPIHSFFQHEAAKKLLYGKPVVTLCGSRNMWVMAHERVRDYIQKAGGRLVGNIVLFDRAPNLLSVISIIRWLLYGKQKRYLGIFPPAGVSATDISGTAKYGRIIVEALQKEDYSELQPELVKKGAVEIKPQLLMIEKRGIVFFRLWAEFIRRKGDYGSPDRLFRVRLFKYYLLFMIYLVSPFVSGLYYLVKPFRKNAIKKQLSGMQGL